MPRTLFEKVWDAHVVEPETADTPAVLYVDLHLVHEVTSPQAFDVLRERKLRVRRPGRTVAIADPQAAAQLRRLEENCSEFGIELHALGSEGQGIVHVIGPEMGLTQPG